MDEFITSLVTTLPGDTCGCTIDWFRGNEDGRVVQWLWAKPASEVSLDEVQAGVAALARISAFKPGNTEGFAVNLPNQVELLDACPFQPDRCQGAHVVASGSGRV